VLAVGQAGHVSEVFATGLLKAPGCADGDLLEGFQAVGNEAWIEDGERFHTFPGELFHGIVRVRLEPVLRAEARLEAGDEFLLVPAEALAQEAGGGVALLGIGIATPRVALRYAVVGGDHHLGLEINGGEVTLDRAGEGVDIDGLVVIGRYSADRRL